MVRLHSFLALNKHQSSNSLASCQPDTNTNTSLWRSATYWSPSPASHDLLWHHITDRIHMLEKHSVHNTQFLSWNVNVHNLLKSVSNGQYQDREWIFGRSGKTTEFGKRLRPSSPLSISEFEDKNFVYQKTTDIGGKVGGGVTYQILGGVSGKDGRRGAEAKSPRRGRGRKQLQSALKTFPTTIFYLSTYQQVPFPPHHELIQVTSH